MGKKNKLRQAQQRHAERAISAVLEAHADRDVPPRSIERYADFKSDYRAKIEAHRYRALRKPEDWRCRIKSRSEDKRLLDLVRFCFARYQVPNYLEQAWIEDCADDFVDRPASLPAHRTAGTSLRPWYIAVAQGGSLYKGHTTRFLTKRETHHFLAAPGDITSIQRALWYAVARPESEPVGQARRVASSNLSAFSIASSYWRDVARFLARNPLPLHEMNDLIDYLSDAKAADASFSLKGRTLQTLQRRKEEWHRALIRQHTVGGGNWSGRDLPDVDYTAGSGPRTAIWRFRQVKTGNALFREGQRMHHCVATYKERCMNGLVSIWSLTCEFPLGQFNRGVTLEVLENGAIVQCRGFANRLPYSNEVTIVKLWARDNLLTWRALER